MAPPRKYVTVEEFEELKESVARIEAGMTSKPSRASVWVDAAELAERLGLLDAYGVPVAVGDCIQPADGGVPIKIRTITVRTASQDGKATVTVDMGGNHALTAVDMRLPGHVVTKKATT